MKTLACYSWRSYIWHQAYIQTVGFSPWFL